MTPNRRFRLAEAAPRALHVCDQRSISLAAGQTKSFVTLCKAGKFFDPRYDWFEITVDIFKKMIRNFDARVFAQDVAIDIEHQPKNGAAGFIRRLFLEGARLRAEVEWTPMGVEAIKEKGFRYLSIEYDENFSDNETGTNHGPVLKGAALTTRPVIKGLDPVTLAAAADDGDSAIRYALSENVYHNLHTERKIAMKEKLFAALLAAGVPETAAKTLSESIPVPATASDADVKSLAEKIAPAIKDLTQGYRLTDGTVKVLADQVAASLRSIDAPSPKEPETGKSLSAADVAGIVSKTLATERAASASAAKTLAEQETANRKIFSEAIAAAKIGEDEKKQLSESLLPGISGGMTADSVKALADLVIKQAAESAVKRKLADLGYGAGTIRFGNSEEQGAMKFAEEKLPEIMGLKTLSEGDRYPQTGKLRDSNKRAAAVALAQFDREHGAQLARESMLVKELADGSTTDILVPRLVQREVIREALQDLVGAAFVEFIPGELNAIVMQLPFVSRSGSPTNSQMRVFEGQTVPTAYLAMDSELAYVNPFKIATKMTNESIHFSRNNLLGYNMQDASVLNLVTLIKEMTDARYFNELYQACDEYGAVAVANESRTAQCNGAHKTFQLVNYPLVPLRKVYDIKGTLISTANPITVTYNAVVLNPWEPGVGAGTYYLVTNHNLGQFQIVDQTGAAITPPNATPLVVSYSYSTNVIKFDTDIPNGLTKDVHLNGFIRAFGAAKANVQRHPRYGNPDFSIMSSVLNNMITDAQKYEESHATEGSSLSSDGNLAMIKGVSCFGVNAPNLLMGDQRGIIGTRRTLKHGLAKAFSLIGDWQERRDANGNYTGVKDIYGEQYDVVQVPGGPNNQVKGSLTSVLAYSVTGDVGPF